jgi:hypothetical protein
MPTPKLTNEIIDAAILGFQGQKRRIDEQIAVLRAMISGGTAEATAAETMPARRKISAAARRKMAAGQRKRWAALKGKTAPETPAVSKPKRRLSAAGRAAIIAATKKRWAAKRAEAAKAAAKK